MKLADDTLKNPTNGQGLVLRWTRTTVRALGGAVGVPPSAERRHVPTLEPRLAAGWGRLAIA